MKIRIIITCSTVFLILLGCTVFKNQTSSRYIISKENGRIILAYKAFEDFLNTEKSWKKFNALLLEAYPELLVVHNKQIGWGAIDSVKFKEEVTNYKMEDWEHLFPRYTEESASRLYDTIIGNAHKILEPINNNPVDLCLFLPYGSCFIEPGKDRSTIFISLRIDTADVEKIMAHEYAHNLHFQRRPEEPMTLKRELVSEGMAVYLTTLIITGLELKNAIPFMSGSSVEWCFKNEQLIKDSIQSELNDSSENFIYKYIADGSIAKPPEGFVQKTAYFTGYRVIEACIEKGMDLEEICLLNSDSVIAKSGYFN